MNNKTKIALGALVIIGVSFFGGIKYGESKVPARGNFTAFAGGARAGGTRGAATGGVTAGQILSKDDTSITIQMRAGGSKIVFVSPQTQVMKTVSGSLLDLKVGTEVTTMGTTNADGSLSAQNIQIRQATSTTAR